jgi:outer membrane protein assembly factor BamB
VRDHVAISGTTLFVGDSDGTIHGWDIRGDTLRYTVPNLSQNNAEPLTATYGYCSVIFGFRDGTIRNLNPHQLPGYDHDERDRVCQFHPALQWTYDVGGPMVVEPITISNPLPTSIIAISEAGHLHSISLARFLPIGGGEQKWTQFIGGNDAVFHSPLTLSLDWKTIYACSSLGEITSINSATGDVLWTSTLPAGCGHGGAVLDGNGQLFVPTSGGIFAVQSEDGSVLWEFKTDSAVSNSPSITESGELVFGTAAGELFSITVVPN